MAETGNCKDCRWWNRRVHLDGSDGFCKSITDQFVKVQEFAVIEVYYPDAGTDAQLVTKPEFGCNQFQNAEASHT